MEETRPKSYCQTTDDGCSRYAEYLRKHEEDKKDIWNDECRQYVDPDEGWRSIGKKHKGDRYEFYANLAVFLNAQEEFLRKKFLNEPKTQGEDSRWKYEQWKYSLEAPEGRKKLGIWASKDGEPVLCLRPDQFGFSAPKWYNEDDRAWTEKYPYASFLSKAPCKYKYQRVADWVWATRTIGGSFIWPITQDGMRGGGSYRRRLYPLQL